MKSLSVLPAEVFRNKLVEVEQKMAEAVKFTEKTIDYAKNPRNQGDMADPTAIGEVSNPDCRRFYHHLFKSGR